MENAAEFLVFDTETAGLPKSWKAHFSDTENWPRAIQIAWAVFDGGGRQLAAESRVIVPDGFRISAEIEKLTGISQAQAEAEGNPIESAMSEFSAALGQTRTHIAHNFNFDFHVLGAEYVRLGQKNALKMQQALCTMKSTADFCKIPGKFGFKWPTLAELHQKIFGTGFAGAHNALHDVEATARCFFELRKKGVFGKESR